MRYNGNMEVCTLTLNPCLDRTLWVEDFGLPPTREEWQTGGKGVNVARVLAALGVEAHAVCPLGGETGARFLELAKAEGIDVLPVDVPAPTRMIDTWAREGDLPKVDYRAGSRSPKKIWIIWKRRSFPPFPARGCWPCAARRRARRRRGAWRASCGGAKKMGVATVLDSNGAALLQGVEGLPRPFEAQRARVGGADRLCRPLVGVEIDRARRGAGAGVAGRARLLSGGRGRARPGGAFAAHPRGARGGVRPPRPRERPSTPSARATAFWPRICTPPCAGWPDEQALTLANAAGAANAQMFPAARVGWKEIGPLMRGKNRKN